MMDARVLHPSHVFFWKNTAHQLRRLVSDEHRLLSALPAVRHFPFWRGWEVHSHRQHIIEPVPVSDSTP